MASRCETRLRGFGSEYSDQRIGDEWWVRYLRGTRVALFVHLIWTTWDRLPLLTGERRVYRCIEDTCHDIDVEVIAIGALEQFAAIADDLKSIPNGD